MNTPKNILVITVPSRNRQKMEEPGKAKSADMLNRGDIKASTTRKKWYEATADGINAPTIFRKLL